MAILKEVIRRHGMSLDTFYREKRQYSGITEAELQRLKAVQDEKRRSGRFCWVRDLAQRPSFR